MGAILLAMFIALALTGAGYAFGLHQEPSSHLGSLFASWVGGVVLFVVVGAVVAIVSVAKPEHESFDTRARILFRGKYGPHIDYIISRIKEMEHYADTTVRKAIIEEFLSADGKFRVAFENTTTVRSYIDDIDSSYQSKLKLKSPCQRPRFGRRNRLVYLRVDGNPIGDGEEFDEEIERPFRTTIPRHGVCIVENRIESWVDIDEPNRHTPTRFTRALQLDVENRLIGGQKIKIRLTRDDERWSEHEILAGNTLTPLSVRDMSPHERVFDFRIEPA